MKDSEARLKLKAKLPRTWGAFFERFGNFTPTQLAGIPPILEGQNVMLCASTASGKTETAVAPLIERNSFEEGLHLLYITPTRALASDIYGRLRLPLEMLRLSLGVKTHDLMTYNPKKPSHILITTPEATDSLLANHTRNFTPLKAIVLDELHLFDSTVRGDQLRVILNRIQQIKSYAFSRNETDNPHIQFVGLSATMASPLSAATRYFDAPVIISLPQKRQINCDLLPLAIDSVDALRDYLYSFREKGWKKALVFCNTRAEVELYASLIMTKSPFGNSVYVHYSNIAPKRRHEIEGRFAQDEAAICFASSTLELGIDIGSIDIVIMLGAPGSIASFLQRIGRGNRRKKTIQIACFYRSQLEELLFRVLLNDPPVDENNSGFRPGVAIQQLFSLIKQSPHGAVRINSIAPLFAEMLTPQDLEAIIGQLVDLHFLQAGKPGEWKAGERLNRLYDEQNSDQNHISIYSNIGSSGSTIAIRNQHTDEVVANVAGSWLNHSKLTLEGQPFNVHWQDQETVWVVREHASEQKDKPLFISARQPLAFEIASCIPLQINLSQEDVFLTQFEERWYLFHWLGDIYGNILQGLMRYHYHTEETPQIGICLCFSEQMTALPKWSDTQIAHYIQSHSKELEVMLPCGVFHRYLPEQLRRRAILEQINIPRLSHLLNSLKLVTDPDRLTIDPLSLIR